MLTILSNSTVKGENENIWDYPFHSVIVALRAFVSLWFIK